MEEVCQGKDEMVEQEIAVKDQIIAAKDLEIKQVTEAKNQEIAEKDRQLSAQESAPSEKDRGLSSLQQRCGLLQTQLDTVQRRNESMEVSE